MIFTVALTMFSNSGFAAPTTKDAWIIYCKNSKGPSSNTYNAIRRAVGNFGNIASCKQAYSRMKDLRVLRLDDQLISDLDPLSNFPNLRFLSLQGNQISELGPLRDLVNLEDLYLSNNKISNLATLRDVPKLRVLSIENNLVEDLNPLAGLRNLWSLNLDGNKISDFSPVDRTGLNVSKGRQYVAQPNSELEQQAAVVETIPYAEAQIVGESSNGLSDDEESCNGFSDDEDEEDSIFDLINTHNMIGLTKYVAQYTSFNEMNQDFKDQMKENGENSLKYAIRLKSPEAVEIIARKAFSLGIISEKKMKKYIEEAQ